MVATLATRRKRRRNHTDRPCRGRASLKCFIRPAVFGRVNVKTDRAGHRSAIAPLSAIASRELVQPFVFPKHSTQLAFGLLESRAIGRRQISPRAIDIEIQHRHRRTKRTALAAPAAKRRAFERDRDLARTLQSKYPRFKIKRVARVGYALRPALRWRHDRVTAFRTTLSRACETHRPCGWRCC